MRCTSVLAGSNPAADIGHGPDTIIFSMIVSFYTTPFSHIIGVFTLIMIKNIALHKYYKSPTKHTRISFLFTSYLSEKKLPKRQGDVELFRAALFKKKQ